MDPARRAPPGVSSLSSGVDHATDAIGDAGRYDRQSRLPGFGATCQARLGAAHAMVIGCGALGCAAIDLLARAGVGRLTVIDRDLVEPSNLQRQSLYSEADAQQGAPKAEAAARRVALINSGVRAEALVEDVTPENVERLIVPHPRPGVLVDCTDNFQTRYLLNDAAVKHGVPVAYGAAVGWAGMVASFERSGGACLRCVFPEPPAEVAGQSCDVAGVFGPVAAMVGAMQAAEAVRMLAAPAGVAGFGGALWTIDAQLGRWQRVALPEPDAACPACRQDGARAHEWLSGARWTREGVVCARLSGGRGAVRVMPGQAGASAVTIDLGALASRLGAHGRFALRGQGRGAVMTGRLAGGAWEGLDVTVFGDGRAVIAGTTDLSVARSLYARLIGV
ncbi:MAG: thiamine biosynthesis protein ThiF [Planctomyces sp.]|nr:thiamine biosynthesis protein ThiF [Planctomyces sp.]